ncbi:acetyl-CoA decarbonylase/synthase complex subunit gamma [[Eubacterium] cellulosolvens]
MALTALDIFKLLPKTNCGDCGVPTCLAFAMKLANKQAELSACPHVSEEAKAELDASAQPPMRLIKIGTGDNELQLGNETELFRHEKKFVHETAIGILVEDGWEPAKIENTVEQANKTNFERVGQEMKLNLIAIKSTTENPETFAKAVETVKSKTQLPLVFMSTKPEVIEPALKQVAASKPLLYAATADNWEAMTKLAKENNCPLVVRGSSLDELVELTGKITGAGTQDLILDFGPKNMGEALALATAHRRLALKKNLRALGYPTLLSMDQVTENEAAFAAIATMKYSGILLLKSLEPWMLYPLFTLRQNIYTDPQVPIQVKQDLYAINNPDENSPLLFTTNFSLTYFTVQGDVENSKVPSWLQVVNTEGLSVMTAFAADKLTPDMVIKALEDSGVSDKIKHNKLIIPGMVSRMSGKLNEKSGREIIVGPRDSSRLPKFLKEL